MEKNYYEVETTKGKFVKPLDSKIQYQDRNQINSITVTGEAKETLQMFMDQRKNVILKVNHDDTKLNVVVIKDKTIGLFDEGHATIVTKGIKKVGDKVTQTFELESDLGKYDTLTVQSDYSKIDTKTDVYTNSKSGKLTILHDPSKESILEVSGNTDLLEIESGVNPDGSIGEKTKLLPKRDTTKLDVISFDEFKEENEKEIAKKLDISDFDKFVEENQVELDKKADQKDVTQKFEEESKLVNDRIDLVEKEFDEKLGNMAEEVSNRLDEVDFKAEKNNLLYTKTYGFPNPSDFTYAPMSVSNVVLNLTQYQSYTSIDFSLTIGDYRSGVDNYIFAYDIDQLEKEFDEKISGKLEKLIKKGLTMTSKPLDGVVKNLEIMVMSRGADGLNTIYFYIDHSLELVDGEQYILKTSI